MGNIPPFANAYDMIGNVALVERGGGCSYTHKYQNALRAGASAVIILGVDPLDTMVTSPQFDAHTFAVHNTPLIPVLSLSDEASEALVAAARARPTYVQLGCDLEELSHTFVAGAPRWDARPFDACPEGCGQAETTQTRAVTCLAADGSEGGSCSAGPSIPDAACEDTRFTSQEACEASGVWCACLRLLAATSIEYHTPTQAPHVC
eukprot:SAG11_NODE_215_length_12235_cov_11.843276_7_plen_206_part_00